jgi:cytochrome c oxidase assembly protein subunit 15
MPRTNGPHAVFCAVRAASALVSPDATAQFSAPLKLTQTSQDSFCTLVVATYRKPPNPRVRPIPMRVDRLGTGQIAKGTGPADGTPRRAWLGRYAWGVLAYNFGVVAWGAFVRASGSGAGCGSHWPLCNGVVVPQDPSVATLIEVTHRVTSAAAGLLVFALAFLVFRTRPRADGARRAVVASVVLMLLEGALGAGLVLLELTADDASGMRAVALALHLANTFLLLAAIALTAWRLDGHAAPRWTAHGTTSVLVFVLLGLTMLTGASGAVTALGDTLFPSGSLREGLAADFSPTSHLLLRLRVWHPALAIATAVAIIAGARWLAAQRPTAVVQRLAALVMLLWGAQVLGGFVNLALLAPTWMQLVHLLMADAAWVALVLLGSSALASAPVPRQT